MSAVSLCLCGCVLWYVVVFFGCVFMFVFVVVCCGFVFVCVLGTLLWLHACNCVFVVVFGLCGCNCYYVVVLLGMYLYLRNTVLLCGIRG